MNRSATGSAKRSVPCLNSNNCIDPSETGEIKQLPVCHENPKGQSLNEFSTSYRKSTAALEMNVKAFIETFGLDKVGFLTLTFADDVTDPKEAQRRFHSLRTNFLKRHFPEYVCVYERTKKGRIHFHLLVNTRLNIRRGLNFSQIAAGNYKTANPYLRHLWTLLRENVGKYGFGRTELLPVKTNSKGLSRYVSKYIAKHINSRLPEDKGYRLVRTSIDKKAVWKMANSNFSFLSKGSKEWRRKLKKWVECVEDYLCLYAQTTKRRTIPPIDQDNYNTVLASLLSPKWAFKNRKTILTME